MAEIIYLFSCHLTAPSCAGRDHWKKISQENTEALRRKIFRDILYSIFFYSGLIIEKISTKEKGSLWRANASCWELHDHGQPFSQNPQAAHTWGQTWQFPCLGSGNHRLCFIKSFQALPFVNVSKSKCLHSEDLGITMVDVSGQTLIKVISLFARNTWQFCWFVLQEKIHVTEAPRILGVLWAKDNLHFIKKFWIMGVLNSQAKWSLTPGCGRT